MNQTEEQILDELLYFDYENPNVVISGITLDNNKGILRKSCNSIYNLYSYIKEECKTNDEL